jgi:hypothetical protein
VRRSLAISLAAVAAGVRRSRLRLGRRYDALDLDPVRHRPDGPNHDGAIGWCSSAEDDRLQEAFEQMCEQNPAACG